MSTSEDKPPVFASWRGWYLLVLGTLALQMLLYYWLTQSFA
jgi:hypothetical protein